MASQLFTAVGLEQATRPAVAAHRAARYVAAGVRRVVDLGCGPGQFLDRLLSLALPRIRDFRGLNSKQFDGHGNYTFGLNEQSMFHEIDQDKIDRVRGMDITVVTTAKTDEEARSLLKQLGFPFKEK